MPWAKLDDGIATHPKFLERTELAKLVFMLSIVYSCRELTDGKLSQMALAIIFAQAGPNALAARSAVTDELIAARLWEYRDGEIWIHDYLVYNPSREQVLAERHRKSEAGKIGGQKSVETRKDRYGSARPEAEREAPASGVLRGSSGTPVPVPVPDPTPVSRSRTIAVAVERATTRAGRGRSFEPPSLEEVREFMDTLDPPRGRCAEDFVDHFEANGWLVGGRTPMRSWQAAARRWARNEDKFGLHLRGNGTNPGGGHTIQSMKSEIGQQLDACGVTFDGD